MSKRPPGLSTYAELKRGVEETLLTGQRRIEQAKVLTYFETGRLINEHVRLAGGRVEFGAHVLDRLARDLQIAKTTLYQCTQFARYFASPAIFRHGGKLGWAHYRLLCQVENETERNALLTQTLKNEWTSPELQERVRSFNASADAGETDVDASPAARPGVSLLAPKRGTPGLFRIVARRDGLAVDLGFKIFRPLTAAEARRIEAGAIVRVDPEGAPVSVPHVTKADLFTYPARVLRVVDGDTILVELQLLPTCVIEQKLRLRGLDCPEVATAEGKAAQRITSARIAAADTVLIYTTKPDKYDRYLADVFVAAADGQEIFLNNALLEHGHAATKHSYSPLDWEPVTLARP